MRPQEFKRTRQGIPVCVQSAKAIIFAISYHRCAHYLRGSEIDPASPHCYDFSAGWSSLVARWAHNLSLLRIPKGFLEFLVERCKLGVRCSNVPEDYSSKSVKPTSRER